MWSWLKDSVEHNVGAHHINYENRNQRRASVHRPSQQVAKQSSGTSVKHAAPRLGKVPAVSDVQDGQQKNVDESSGNELVIELRMSTDLEGWMAFKTRLL